MRQWAWHSVVLLPVILFVVSFSMEPASGQTYSFGFYNHPMYYDETTGITFYNSDMEGDGITSETIDVTINAPCYSNPIDIILSEDTNRDDGYFSSPNITFVESSCTPSSIGPPSTSSDFDLQVKNGDLISVSMNESPYLDDSVLVEDQQTGINWAPKRTDHGWASCSNYGGDNDNDGICQDWETGTTPLTINHPSGTPYECTDPGETASQDPSLECPQPDPETPDIYLEIDFMKGHEPNPTALQEVIDAFAAKNINLHIQIDEELPHKDELAFGGINHPRAFGFDQVKAYYFGTPDERETSDWSATGWKQKKQVFHYAIYAHSQKGSPTSSGAGELNGNDIMITFGGWPNSLPPLHFESGVLMHEIGHNLNLHHGGDPSEGDVNCKPNYLSVMNYARMFPILITDRPLDYSSQQLPSINEGNLDETVSLGGPANQKAVFGPTPPLVLPYANDTIDWNQDGDKADTGLAIHTNYLDSEGCFDNNYETLTGYNDWDNLNFNSRGTANWADADLEHECKFGKPKRGGCPADHRSPWYHDYGKRIIAQGQEEPSYEDAKNHYKLKVMALKDYVRNLSPQDFERPSDIRDFKKDFDKDFKAADVRIDLGWFDGSIENVNKMKGKLMAERRLASVPHAQDKLSTALDDLENSLRKMNEYGPTTHPDPTPATSFPPWVDNTIFWYAEGSIPEEQFIDAIEFLAKKGIIDLSPGRP